VGIAFAEIASMLLAMRRRAGRFDHWAHLGGLFAGTVWAMVYKSRKERNKKEGGGRNRPYYDQRFSRMSGLMGR
jgi:membrane associated rhomboid family serine protease